jgi:hypothetical protein
LTKKAPWQKHTRGGTRSARRCRARKALRKEQLILDPKQLVFIDETAATTKMTRLYGRAAQGKRLVDKVPHGHWKTTTFICGLQYDGVTAPFVLDGPMDGPHFLAYVEQILAPTLKKGQIVFLDNVSTHKVDGVEEAIEARGARAVFLPAYSPDLSEGANKSWCSPTGARPVRVRP